MVDTSKLPNQIGIFSRKSPESNAWIGPVIALVHKDNVHFGVAKPVGASIKKVDVSSNEEAIEAIKSFKWPLHRN